MCVIQKTPCGIRLKPRYSVPCALPAPYGGLDRHAYEIVNIIGSTFIYSGLMSGLCASKGLEGCNVFYPRTDIIMDDK